MNLPKATAVILTALDVESEEVMRHLTEIGEIRHPAGNSYTLGAFKGEMCSWAVVLGRNDKRNVRTAIFTERAIRFFSPDAIIFVGCAGARKDCTYGDVVVPDRVFDYEAGAETRKGFQGADQGGTINPAIVSQIAEWKGSWRKRVERNGRKLPSGGLKVLPIASGEKTQKVRKSPGLQQTDAAAREAAAFDTESLGFFLAQNLNRHGCAFIVRGISDNLSDKNARQDKIQQPMASALASAVAFEFLAKRTPEIHLASSNANAVPGTAKIFDLITQQFRVPEAPAEGWEESSPIDIDLGALAEGGLFAEAIAEKASGRDFEELDNELLLEILTLLQKKGDLENAWRFLFEASSRPVRRNQALAFQAHVYSIALKLFSQRGDESGAKLVVENFENVIDWVARSNNPGKVASVFSRAGVAYSVLGKRDESRSCFIKAAQHAKESSNIHQSVTVRILWAIASRLRGVDFDGGEALQTVIEGQREYLENAVDPRLAQAYALKSTVQCLFAEAAMLLRAADRDKGLLRLAAASVIGRRAFAHPAAEGFAELLALIPDEQTKNYVRSAMEGTPKLNTIPGFGSLLRKCVKLLEFFSFVTEDWERVRSFLAADGNAFQEE